MDEKEASTCFKLTPFEGLKTALFSPLEMESVQLQGVEYRINTPEKKIWLAEFEYM